MDGEIEDFSAECMDEEIDWDYEFDAALFYDFCKQESPFEVEEAQRWFETAGNYPPSPLIVKLNLVKNSETAERSHDPSRLREEHTTRSSNDSLNKLKTEETLSIGRTKAKINSESRSLKDRGSTLMNPTASHLAKVRSQKPPSKTNERSSWNSSGSYNAATKRQKLESGYLRKVTVPRDPHLETMQRALRRRSKKDLESSDNAKANAQPLNAKILKDPVLPPRPRTTLRSPELHVFKLKTMERASRNASANLLNIQNVESAAHSTSVDFKRNTWNAAQQGNYVIKRKALRCNKDCKSTVNKRLPVHPPVELFNKLSLRSERETSIVSD